MAGAPRAVPPRPAPRSHRHRGEVVAGGFAAPPQARRSPRAANGCTPRSGTAPAGASADARSAAAAHRRSARSGRRPNYIPHPTVLAGNPAGSGAPKRHILNRFPPAPVRAGGVTALERPGGARRGDPRGQSARPGSPSRRGSHGQTHTHTHTPPSPARQAAAR